MDCLLERHQLGVDKADDHDRRCGGALNDRGNTETGEQTRDLAAGQSADHDFELTARASFQRITHQIHTEQEQTQTADQRKYVENIHLHNLVGFMILMKCILLAFY